MDWTEEIQTKLAEFGVEIQPLGSRSIQMNAKKVLFVDAEHSVEEALADIIIHEDLFQFRPKQLFSRLRSLMGLNTQKVHGRKTKVISISKKEAADFIDEHHLLEFAGGKHFYGLMEKTELVAVAVFSRAVWMKNESPPYYSTELVRYCSKSGCTVVGGLDKLVRYFFNQHETDDLVTYIDREWSDGSSYQRLGFVRMQETEPIQFVVNRSNWQRKPYRGGGLGEGGYVVSNRGNVKLRKTVAT